MKILIIITMKKFIIFMLLVVSCLAAHAATYRVTYDIINQKKTALTVIVKPDRLTIGGRTYSLRQLGTITNSGLLFNSYMYGKNENMFCVSTTSITVDKDMFTRLKGYIIIIDNKAYLAERIN